MKKVIEFEHNNHKICVSYAYGTDDGWYWDKQYFIIIDKKPYIFLVIGSGSGWIGNDNSLKQVDFDYLEDRKKENSYSYIDGASVEDFAWDKEKFVRLFDFMIENNATEVRESDEYDFDTGGYELLVVE